MVNDIDYERRKAVANAWKAEKQSVLNGRGTRDWSQKEQREILSKGRATGYQGHHMKSVNGHNSKAGDASNIQFLNSKEHLAAHGGNFRNKTNGCFDPVTGKMNEFGRSTASIDSKSLLNPLSEGQIKKLSKGGTDIKNLEALQEKAKTMDKRAVNKTEKQDLSSSKTLTNQRSLSKPASASEGTYQSKTLNAQRSERRTTGSVLSKNQSHRNKH